MNYHQAYNLLRAHGVEMVTAHHILGHAVDHGPGRVWMRDHFEVLSWTEETGFTMADEKPEGSAS